MSDLFKKPIIFELKASQGLSFKFSIIAGLPIISLLALFEKYPYLILSFDLIILAFCTYYIRQFALRINKTSIVKIRLHRRLATLFQKNNIVKTHEIKTISLAPEWVIFVFDGSHKKLIIDQTSTDLESYSAIRRELTQFNSNQ